MPLNRLVYSWTLKPILSLKRTRIIKIEVQYNFRFLLYCLYYFIYLMTYFEK